jgi:phage tail-like protein
MAVYYPPPGFHFSVDFELDEKKDGDQRFQEVSGMSREINTDELREGGENRFGYHLPTKVTYPNLVLKRGLLTSSGIIGWLRDALEQFSVKPANLYVTLLNEKHEPLAKWYIVNAYPVKWSISTLKADENAIVVETLELKYQRFNQIDV